MLWMPSPVQIGVADSDGKGSPVYSVCKPTAQANSHFYAYAVREMARSQWIQALATGIRERSTDFRFKNFCSQLVPLPPLPEQTTIVRYLDHVDLRIQRYISGKQKLIKLLEEQKQAIIHRAVTRGLDSNVHLKPSGVEWLGEVAEHWEVKPLKHAIKLNQTVLPETTKPDFEFSYIDIGSVGTGVLLESPKLIRFATAPSRARRIVHEGDTIVSTVRTYLKAVWFASEKPDKLICSTGFAVLTPDEAIIPKFMSYLVQSNPFTEQVTANSVGTAYPAIAEGQLGSFHIPLPPLPEQAVIVEYLDKTTANINTAFDRARRQIELLSEYRTRLITDVVTGKLDVRDVEIPASGEEPAFDGTDGLEEETESDEADVIEEVYGDD